MIMAWVTSSFLILKANLMPLSNGNLSKIKEELEEEAGEGTCSHLESYESPLPPMLDSSECFLSQLASRRTQQQAQCTLKLS